MKNLTPAQRHLQKEQALEESRQKDAHNPHGAQPNDAYQLLLSNLAEHERTLKKIHSVETKAEFKLEHFGEFEGHIDGILQAGIGTPDDVFATLFAWAIDASLYDKALAMAAHLIKHDLSMPDQFKRTPAVFLMDEISTAALAGKLDQNLSAPLLQKVIDLTQTCDAPDPARAKLYKAHVYASIAHIGISADNYKPEAAGITAEQGAQALSMLNRVTQLDANSGVKKDIRKLEGFIKNKDPALWEKIVRPAPTAAQAEDGNTDNAPADPPLDT